ncbi:MAG: glycosyltransferase family 39 protein [Anaerolineae bacterium]|nr:glycosyltransferase family 39 protein [Anaerolineae bacterium]
MVRHAAARSRLILLLILLAAFGLRLHRLGAQSLWYDETVSVHLAGKPVPALIAHTAGDIHPPGYYLLLRGWLLLFGYPTGHADADGHGLEFAAALLSLVFGMMLIPLIYTLGRRLYDEPTALLAAALTAISPFHVWYAQEVRMYTLGAVLGLICLRCIIHFVSPQMVSGSEPKGTSPNPYPLTPDRCALILYVLAAAAGLYVLYYFAFLLVALNLWVIVVACSRLRPEGLRRGVGRGARPGGFQVSGSRFRLRAWFLAQAAVLLLYAPWLPIAWRQATDPPVPPWRTFTGLWDMLTETWSALSFGQSVEPQRVWPLLVMTAALYILGLLRRETKEEKEMEGMQEIVPSFPSFPSFPLAIHTLVPVLLVFLASLFTPLYHVRYVFAYAPPFSLVLAAGIVALLRWRRWRRPLAVGALAVILAASGFSLHNLWGDPRYASDDHRAAARLLSEQWRPGDVILVNAGYSYTALLTYLQLPIAWRGRLSDYTPAAASADGAVIVQTGHIDGDPRLGWGDPASDFYALPGDLAKEKLALLLATHPRLWHYRIYDTVNDPQGVIRGLLDAYGELFEDRVFTGEANMRVQGVLPRQRAVEPPADARRAAFGDLFTLYVPPCCGTLAAGQTLYTALFWQVRQPPAADYATSLRLVDAQGRVWSQPPDERPLGSLYTTSRWPAGGVERQPVRLPVPGDTPPGRYSVELVLYDPAMAEPLPAVSEDGLSVADGHRLQLGGVEITLPEEPSMRPGERPLARFDYIELLEAYSPATRLRPGDVIPVKLCWRPRPSPYVDDYLVVLQLLDAGDRIVARAAGRPVDGRYPTSLWATDYPVGDRHELTVPADAPPGRYRLVVALERASDGQRIPARRGPFGLLRGEYVILKAIELAP